ncbi:MAG: osmoprotectant transport system permease protein [Clostridia bacterium]|nr:osmoprotectant transport system permease protein [Clostridia bacterium]
MEVTLSSLWATYLERSAKFWLLTREHFLLLVVLPVTMAAAVAIPLGILASKQRWIQVTSLAFANLMQTIPSLALLAILIALGAGIGNKPAIIALFLYSLLPILRNTYTGIKNVDNALLEAARGMGMTATQILIMVELPLAFPVIMAGIRTAAVICVGLATLAAFVGGGGLGDFIVTGLGMVNNNLTLLGAIPAAVMALLLDYILGKLEYWLTPRGLRI